MKPMTRIEHALAAAIATGEEPGCPPKLAGAIRHAVFPGGARIRPQLCLAVAQAMAVERLFRTQRLQRGIDHRKQCQRGDAQIDGALGGLQQDIERLPLDARHRRNLLAAPIAFENENRVNKVVDREHRLAHQATGKIIAPHPAHAGFGITPGNSHVQNLKPFESRILVHNGTFRIDQRQKR